MPRKLTTEEFIKRSEIIHRDKYDYSLVDYINSKYKVKIICPIHGEFSQTPNNHLQKYGCFKCRYIKSAKTNSSNIEKFIKNANDIHKNKYNYKLVEYINTDTKVKIICPIHGRFEQSPHSHLRGRECFECGKEKISKANRSTVEEFIVKSRSVHKNKYDYTLVEYINNYTDVKITCPIHGEFKQRPNNHLSGAGCNICSNSSNGEKKVKKYLKNNKIQFIPQYKFDNCIDKRKLPFDFYLPDLNTLIEYDGIQHFQVVKHFRGEIGFKKRQLHDRIKNNYCIENDIKLIRIKYDENIEERLEEIYVN